MKKNVKWLKEEDNKSNSTAETVRVEANLPRTFDSKY